MNRWNFLVTIGLIGGAAVASFTTVGAIGACNSGNGDCPDKATIVPGASCDDEHLQCAFDLTTPPAACDGTTSVIETSCTCTDGLWTCPSAIECEAGADAGEEAGDDAGEEASTDDGAADSSDSSDLSDAGDAGDAGDAHD